MFECLPLRGGDPRLGGDPLRGGEPLLGGDPRLGGEPLLGGDPPPRLQPPASLRPSSLQSTMTNLIIQCDCPEYYGQKIKMTCVEGCPFSEASPFAVEILCEEASPALGIGRRPCRRDPRIPPSASRALAIHLLLLHLARQQSLKQAAAEVVEEEIHLALEESLHVVAEILLALVEIPLHPATHHDHLVEESRALATDRSSILHVRPLGLRHGARCVHAPASLPFLSPSPSFSSQSPPSRRASSHTLPFPSLLPQPL